MMNADVKSVVEFVRWADSETSRNIATNSHVYHRGVMDEITVSTRSQALKLTEDHLPHNVLRYRGANPEPSSSGRL
jgi:hypothetical protein